jgi:hypothetical protein
MMRKRERESGQKTTKPAQQQQQEATTQETRQTKTKEQKKSLSREKSLESTGRVLTPLPRPVFFSG